MGGRQSPLSMVMDKNEIKEESCDGGDGARARGTRGREKEKNII